MFKTKTMEEKLQRTFGHREREKNRASENWRGNLGRRKGESRASPFLRILARSPRFSPLRPIDCLEQGSKSMT